MFSRRKSRAVVKRRAESLEPEAQSPKPKADAYVSALTMLARRELSEAQVRVRLARKGYEDDEIEAAIERLRSERAIDDARVAEAIAHTEVAVHRRGKLRVERNIERAGIRRELARRAVDEVFGSVDADALLDEQLTRRLRGRTTIADRAEARRLYRYLVGKGFEPDKIIAALERRRRGRP